MIRKLACMMLLSFIFIFPLAEGKNVISIEPMITHIYPQQNFSVNVSIDLDEGANGVQCDIFFNPSFLYVDSIEDGKLFQQWWDMLLDVDNENGTIKNIVAFNFGKNTSYSGTFAIIHFKSKTEGISSINLSNVLISNITSNGTPVAISIEVINGSVVIDATPPNTFIIEHPEELENSSTIYFKWMGMDNGTTTENLTYSYHLNTFPWSDWTSNVSHTYELPDGMYEFEVRAMDEAGNVDPTPAAFSFSIDTKPPVIGYSLNPSQPDGENGWYVSNVEVSLTSNDSSGINYTMYRIDGGWQEYDTSFTLSNNGNQFVEFYSVDNAGNKNESSFTVKIDKEEPLTNIIISGEKEGNNYISSVTISFDAQDSFSGIKETKYRINGGTWNTYTGAFSIEGNGAYNIEYYSIDKAGNMEEVNERAFIIQQGSKPTADFTFFPLSPYRNDVVHFHDNSVGTITTWFWNFGDGATSNEREPTHSYVSIGTYNITLTVSGPFGMDVKTKKITILNAIPIASFTYSPKNISQGDPINFTSLSVDIDGSIENYTWYFGDGDVAYGKNVKHVYTMNGTYNVTLVIKDNDGAINETEHSIFISPLPDLVITSADFSKGEIITYIINNGSAEANNFSCSIFIDNKFFDETSIPSLSPKEKIYCNFSLHIEGNHEITIIVDADNKIKEINEENNEKRLSISISKPFPLNIIFLVILVIIVLVAILFILRKRGAKEVIVDEERVKICSACLGKIKHGISFITCSCGQIFHKSCASRINKCPNCGKEFSISSKNNENI